MAINSRLNMQLSLNDPNISANILNEIATDLEVSETILIDVIIHSNTDENVLMSIVNNPNATSIVLANILQHPKISKEILINIFKNQNFDSIVLEHVMSIYSDEYIREILIILLNNEDVFSLLDLLNLLSIKMNKSVIEEIIINKLKEIAESYDADENVLMDVLSNRYVNEEILIIIARNPNATFIVFQELLANTLSSIQILKEIFKNPNFGENVFKNIFNNCVYFHRIAEIDLMIKHEYANQDLFVFMIKNIPYSKLTKNLLKVILNDNTLDYVLSAMAAGCALNELMIILNHKNINLVVYNTILENPNANPAILIRSWEKSNNLLNSKQKLQEILDYSDKINLEIINYILAFHRTRKANIEGSDAIFKLPADLISYILKFLFLEETGFVLPVKKSNFRTSKQYDCITFSNYEKKIEESINKTIEFKTQQNKKKHVPRIDR